MTEYFPSNIKMFSSRTLKAVQNKGISNALGRTFDLDIEYLLLISDFVEISITLDDA